ncbi:MAG TPA: hypothetical protein VM709_07280 [Candidatus Sulfotelmatobacter sp.]|nr:hypothetical protein [Candidatus Sulfotelmatobacter sp.]
MSPGIGLDAIITQQDGLSKLVETATLGRQEHGAPRRHRKISHAKQ